MGLYFGAKSQGGFFDWVLKERLHGIGIGKGQERWNGMGIPKRHKLIWERSVTMGNFFLLFEYLDAGIVVGHSHQKEIAIVSVEKFVLPKLPK
jgi:hypothetical protein